MVGSTNQENVNRKNKQLLILLQQQQLVEDKNKKISSTPPHRPCPGTKQWMEYSNSRYRIQNFCDEIIPQLSDLSIVNPNLFTEDVTYLAEDGSSLLKGRESLANFYQSVALTRKGTGGSWNMEHCKLIDWEKNEVAVEYAVKLSGSWNIRGTDIYTLDTSTTKEERPVIRQVQNVGKLTAVNPNGSKISVDSQWLIKNLATAFESDDSVKASRDFLTELLMQQPGMRNQVKGSTMPTSRPAKRLSESAAATCYYIMSDMYEQCLSMFDISSSRVIPPASEYMTDNVELRGYLDESILKGSLFYNRSLSSVIFALRDSIRQKRILMEKVITPRIELLMPSKDIQLTLTFSFRIPPPGAGVILPESVSSPPVKIKLVSRYKIDDATGLIVEHRLVETRINGQLTPGDQVSRWIQRFLKADGTTMNNFDGKVNNDIMSKALSDAMSFFRTINSDENE